MIILGQCSYSGKSAGRGYCLSLNVFISCGQVALWMIPSLCLSVTVFQSPSVIVTSWNYHRQKSCPYKRSSSQRSKLILPQFVHFRTVTPIQIHSWLLNYAQRLKSQRRCALLFFKIFRQILRSHENISPILTRIEWFRTVFPFQFTGGCDMMYRAWSGIEEVPYCFSRSSIIFQSHMGRQIFDLASMRAFLGGNSKFELTDGHERTHIGSRSMEEVPYCFLRSCTRFQGH